MSLDFAQTLARRANPGLGIARQRVIESRNRRLERLSDYFPRLATEATFSQVGARQALAIPRGAFGLLQCGEPVPVQPVVVPQGGTSLFLQATRIEQLVTQLFKVRAGHRAPVAEERSAEPRLRQAEGDLSLAVERAYCDLLGAKAQYRAESAAARRDAARLAADQVASGTALPSIGLAAEAARLQAEADLFQARLGIRLAQAALAGGRPRPALTGSESAAKGGLRHD